ncbi:MAG: YncE family protein [Nitrospirota bacterium]|jgi:YVTN family beta-propeller protein
MRGKLEMSFQGVKRTPGWGLRILMKALLAVSLALLATGCAAVEERREAPRADRGQFTLYMNGPGRASLDITFLLDAIYIESEDGAYREVVGGPAEISSHAMAGRQKLLGEVYLPRGKYSSLRATVKKATVRRDGREADLALPQEAIELPINVEIEEGQNVTLFLAWEPDASIAEEFMFSPALSVEAESPGLVNLLLFVSNENSDNVTVINRQSDEVVATVKTGRSPRGIATGLSRDNQRVYVANSGSGSITVIDPSTNRVESEIPVRFGRNPEGIAVAKLEDDRELIYVANYVSDNVSVLDADTYDEIEDARVGRGPIAVAVDPDVDEILKSPFLMFDDINLLRSYRESFFNVYVANNLSKDVSVLRVDNSTGLIDDIFTVDVEWGPVALTVDPHRAKVFVANYNSDKLSVIDMVEIARNNFSGAVSAINDVGTAVVGVIADPSLERLYLLKEREGEILLIRPSSESIQQERLAVTPIMGTVPAGDSPRWFLLDPEERKIYVVDRGSDSVKVIDKSTRRREKVVPVGKKPYGIAVFPEF